MQSSVVTYSKLLEHPEFRIDAECYKPYHLEVEQAIVEKGYKLVQDHTVSVINFGAYSLCNYIAFLDSGKPFLVTEDIKNNEIETGNLHYISDSVHLLLHKSHCVKGQVLLTMAGAYLGRAAVFNEDFECSSNQAIAKITLKSNSINPYYLSTFLNCRHGQSQIERFKTGTGQPNLNLGLIKLIRVVDASNPFQTKIDEIVNIALRLKRKSVDIYQEAQKILISELGLFNWRPKHRLSFVKNYSDTNEAERLDAEYFQPRYDEIVNAIKRYPGGWDTLGNIASLKKCVEVGSDAYMDEGDIPFIRVSNLSPFEITEEKYISNELYTELSQHQPQKGEILFSKDGTPGIAYHLNEKPKKMLPSGGILRLKVKSKQINEDYLTLVLNSMIVQEQINRDVGGSIILHWRPDQVKQTVIPIFDGKKQQQIAQKITEAFDLRKQSKHLLECAKCAVEIAIDQNEDAAIKWLQEQTSLTGLIPEEIATVRRKA
ncbi:MAG: restriction endonuclease subunit S [Nitrospirae bacterium]|nr:restriction endonuclease subunit S [Nitrospirota bacterium]